MIKGTLKSFEQRVIERGYSLADVEACIVERHGDVVVIDETHPAYPKKRGLGDMVADGLAAVGITKERVSKAIGRPCGCGKRQEKLNELGRKFGIG